MFSGRAQPGGFGRQFEPEDFAASLYTKMGVDPNQMLHTNTGRPVPLVNDGRLIKELFV